MVDPIRTPPPGFDDLPVEAQIDYVEALWERVAAHPDRVPLPGWHRDELERRADADRRDPGRLSRWEEVRERILRNYSKD
jgi:putative addiction module component (TIGR02574 family)